MWSGWSYRRQCAMGHDFLLGAVIALLIVLALLWLVLGDDEGEQ